MSKLDHLIWLKDAELGPPLHARFLRWVRGGAHLERIEPQMSATIQGIGRLDCKLIVVDEVLGHAGATRETELGRGLLREQQLMLSQLWVFGAYEIVRTLVQRLRADPRLIEQSTMGEFADLKHEFERIRIPLAKHEAADKHPDEGPFAWPSFDAEKGVAWMLAAGTIVARRELADSFIARLDLLQ